MIAKSVMCHDAKPVRRIPLLACETFLRGATYALGDAHGFFAELAWQRLPGAVALQCVASAIHHAREPSHLVRAT